MNMGLEAIVAAAFLAVAIIFIKILFRARDRFFGWLAVAFTVDALSRFCTGIA